MKFVKAIKGLRSESRNSGKAVSPDSPVTPSSSVPSSATRYAAYSATGIGDARTLRAGEVANSEVGELSHPVDVASADSSAAIDSKHNIASVSSLPPQGSGKPLRTSQDEHPHSADISAVMSGSSFVPEHQQSMEPDLADEKHVAEVERSNEGPTHKSVKVTNPPIIALDGLQVQENNLSLLTVKVNSEQLEETSDGIQSEGRSAAIHPGYTLSPELQVGAVKTKESPPVSTSISVEDTPAQGIALVPRFLTTL